jgi:hypothetical protein
MKKNNRYTKLIAADCFPSSHRRFLVINQYILGGIFLFVIVMLLTSFGVMAQSTTKLLSVKSINKKEENKIGGGSVENTQVKQTGNLFEYLSMPAAGGGAETWFAESLPVVFTTVDRLPVLAGNEKAWIELLAANKAMVVPLNEVKTSQAVLISYLVDATGSMYDVQILNAANEALSQKAIALMKMVGTSKPAFAQGQAVAYRGQMVLLFN